MPYKLANFKFFVVPINQISVVSYYHTLESNCMCKYILVFCNKLFHCKSENGAKINHMI